MEQQINVVEYIWYYWVFFIIATIIGSIASSLINNNGKALMCGWENGISTGVNGEPGKYCLGIIADIIIGFAAALGILYTLTPQTALQLIGIGTLAGYGGSSTLRALTNKLEAQVSQQKANGLERQANENKDAAEKYNLMYSLSDTKFMSEEQSIIAIKDYLLVNYEDVLRELYEKNIVR